MRVDKYRPTAIKDLPSTFAHWLIFTDSSYHESGDEYSSGRDVPILQVETYTDPAEVEAEVGRRTRQGLKFRCFKVSNEVTAEVTVKVNV